MFYNKFGMYIFILFNMLNYFFTSSWILFLHLVVCFLLDTIFWGDVNKLNHNLGGYTTCHYKTIGFGTSHMYFIMDRNCINHRSRFLSWSIEQIYLKTSLKGPHLFLTFDFLGTQKNLINCCSLYEEFNIL